MRFQPLLAEVGARRRRLVVVRREQRRLLARPARSCRRGSGPPSDYELRHARVLVVVGAVDVLGLARLSRRRSPRRSMTACSVAFEVERGVGALAEPGGDVARRRQRHRNGPGQPVGQPPLADHALVVGAAHEALERRERADGDHLEVGELAHVQLDARQLERARAQLGGAVGVGDAVDELAAVRRDGVLFGAHGSVLVLGCGCAGRKCGSAA